MRSRVLLQIHLSNGDAMKLDENTCDVVWVTTLCHLEPIKELFLGGNRENGLTGIQTGGDQGVVQEMCCVEKKKGNSCLCPGHSLLSAVT